MIESKRDDSIRHPPPFHLLAKLHYLIYKLLWTLRMHPMTSIERLENHLRKVSLDEGYVLTIYVL